MKKYTDDEIKVILESHRNLSRADLSEANLSRADLSRANLSGADLSRANLSEANLSRADLSRANLRRANLSGADLSRANLSEANLDKRYIVISCIGSRKDSTTYCFDDDKIWCGCFSGTLEEFEAQINKTHKHNSKYLLEYLKTVEYIKKLKNSKEVVTDETPNYRPQS